MAQTREIEVIVVDDHPALLRGVELLLRQAGLRVVGVATTLDQATALLTRRRHDVALVDVHLGGASTIAMVKESLSRDPDAPIVLYTGYVRPEDGLYDAIHAGARGFVLKSAPVDRLLAALHAVAAGGTFVDPDIAAVLSADADVARLRVLSPREREVLNLLADGLSGDAIAARLVLSPETVRTHVRNATGKLGAHTRVHAVALLMRGRGSL